MNWKEANEWELKANGAESYRDLENLRIYTPVWSFDCNFKLDYDGPLVTVSSRFYPHFEKDIVKWDGHVFVYLFNKEVLSKYFIADGLDDLKLQIEKYINNLKIEIKE